MKPLKTLDMEALKEKMPEIENILEEHDAVLTGANDAPYDCVAQCGARIYEQYGFRGKQYSGAGLQHRVDLFYDPTGSTSGYAVWGEDVPKILSGWFEGGTISLSTNYQAQPDRYVILVVRTTGYDGNLQGHAVQLMNINHDGTIAVWDPQANSPGWYHINDVALAFETTGARRLPKQ